MTPSRRQSAEFSPSVNCLIVCVYILAGYINGRCGDHTLFSFLVGAVGIVLSFPKLFRPFSFGLSFPFGGGIVFSKIPLGGWLHPIVPSSKVTLGGGFRMTAWIGE
jgi:hypothetical protein